MTRSFEDREAKRERVPLLIGLTGPSGGGKTYSALRLATGIQRVTGGDIHVIDTEARRALHYADQFRFRHVEFKAPFGPLDYLAAVEHCVKRGAKIVIVDSMSHEHEGPGGVLEMHAAETKRLAAAWKCGEKAAQMSAWIEPKAQRRRMINTLLQLPISGIFCFRAKEKIRPVKGGEPVQMGFCPIAGEEFTFEMTVNCLLLPRADGVPTWQSSEIGERMTMKLPRQFARMFERKEPLSEDIGESMARWADGTQEQGPTDVSASLAARIATADESALAQLSVEVNAAFKSRAISREVRDRLVEAGRVRRSALTAAKEDGPEVDPETGEFVPPPSEADEG